MSSVVYYKFKSQKTPHRINFDGTGISVFDLKREILLANKLEQTAQGFDLKLINPDTGELYDDDSEVIPRSTSVEAKRTPAVRQGEQNSAAKYVSGHLVVTAKNASRRENFGKSAAAPAPSAMFVPPPMSNNPEDEMMQAVLQAQGEQWKRTQEEMAEKAPVYHSNADSNAKPPPPTYICHRCGQRGHWITQCPSITDPNWEIKRVRKTTGIPKSMLRTVDKPAEDDNGAYLMNADGEYVVAVADDKSWQDFQKRQKIVQQKQKKAAPEHLQDPITGDLLVDPKKTPCCNTTYSDSSIQDALISSEFECPKCHKKDVYIDQLIPDTEMEKELEEYNGKQLQQQQDKDEARSPEPQDDEGDLPRKKLRRDSTSTYSESVSSRSTSPDPEDADSPAYSIGSPGSEASVGEAPPPAPVPPVGANDANGMFFPPPFMMPGFMMNGMNN